MRAIIFDLDDTLVKTSEALIKPLEMQAASRMASAGISESDSRKIIETILRLRRDDPDRVEEVLAQDFPQLSKKALMVRRSVFADATPDGLQIEPAVKSMLRELAERYDTYLLTVGRQDFQNRKLELLGIRTLFKAVTVLASGSEETKERWLSSLVDSGYSPSSVVVVGNRLDNEIRAGNRLGMTTVWVKRGEGSGLSPCEETGHPGYIISDITEFPKILAEIESSHSPQTSAGLKV